MLSSGGNTTTGTAFIDNNCFATDEIIRVQYSKQGIQLYYYNGNYNLIWDSQWSKDIIILRKSTSQEQNFSNGNNYNINIESISGYKYFAITQIVTNGFVASCYAYPIDNNKFSVWVASGGGYGSIDVYALYMRDI